ncbi:MAG: hypothetical protein FWB72_07290 [Firmicutes bacterium]|nr:hypothetical protein [Bacillota bacterium]
MKFQTFVNNFYKMLPFLYVAMVLVTLNANFLSHNYLLIVIISTIAILTVSLIIDLTSTKKLQSIKYTNYT